MIRRTLLWLPFVVLVLALEVGCSSNTKETNQTATAAAGNKEQTYFDMSVQRILEVNRGLPDYEVLKNRIEKLSNEKRPGINTFEDREQAIKDVTHVVADFYMELGKKLGDHKHESK